MKLLVHYNRLGTKAFGIWWADPLLGWPLSVYDPQRSNEEVRGKLIVLDKSNAEWSWERWFDELPKLAPYFESWVCYDSMGMSPEQFLDALLIEQGYS